MEQVSVCYVCFLCQVPDALWFLINWDGYFWVLVIENAGSNPVNDSPWTLLHNARLLTETAAFHFHSKPASLKTALWFYVFKWPQLANSDWMLMNCAGSFEWWDKYKLLSPKKGKHEFRYITLANCCYVNGNAAIIKYNKYLLPAWFIHTILTKITSAPSWCFPPRCALRVDGAKQAHGVRMLQVRREVFPELNPLHVLTYLDNLVENSSHLPLNYTAGTSLGWIKNLNGGKGCNKLFHPFNPIQQSISPKVCLALNLLHPTSSIPPLFHTVAVTARYEPKVRTHLISDAAPFSRRSEWCGLAVWSTQRWHLIVVSHGDLIRCPWCQKH